MGKLNYQPREITAALENKLSIRFREGKERVGWYYLEGKKAIRFTIPHIHKSWGPGTINDIARRSRLTKDEFGQLVDCPIDARSYEEIVRSRLIV